MLFMIFLGYLVQKGLQSGQMAGQVTLLLVYDRCR